MITAIFDASALVKLMVPESGWRTARAAYDDCDRPATADWAMLECAQALWRKTRLGDLSAEDASLRLHELHAIDLDALETDSVSESALALALSLDHAVYDCAYVALALAESAALVTADRKLREVATAVGVDVIWIDSAAD